MPPFRNNGPGSPPFSASRAVPAGFLPSNRRPPTLAQLSRRELLDLYSRNQKVLNEPAPSTSTYHQRVVNEQAAIENILGMETIESALQNTHITEDDSMGIELNISPSRTVDAKRRAINRYHNNTSQKGATKALGLDEAMQLEQQATLAEMERRKQEEENRRNKGLPIPGEILTREEREAKIWAFMNAKPTDSDEEDEDWNFSSDEEEDPANWFEYDEDEESQGHPLVDPDDLVDIIRVDDDRFS